MPALQWSRLRVNESPISVIRLAKQKNVSASAYSVSCCACVWCVRCVDVSVHMVCAGV